MRKLICKLSKVTDASPYNLLRSYTCAAARRTKMCRNGCVPQGHLPVYVGDEMERFIVCAELLNHPIFVKLLNQSAAEYGYEHRGALRIPCKVFVFEQVLEAMRVGSEARDLHDLVNSISDEYY